MAELQAGPFVLWRDYGSDGWQPEVFQTRAAMLAAVESGQTYGSRFLMTRRMELRADDVPTTTPGERP